MKTRTGRFQESGNTLIIVLMVGGIITACLGSYLGMTSRQNNSVMRSLCWNAALPLAEAGVEEALTQINTHTNGYNADGWTASGASYTKSRMLSSSNGYTVRINGNPGAIVTITSTGSAKWTDSTFISRTVQVTAQTAPQQLPMGMIANSITFGGTLGVDSYDSSDPNLSGTNGVYDPNKNSDQALVASTGQGFALGGSSHVLGFVETAPGGLVTTRGAASVGDKNFTGKGIQRSPTNHFSATFTNAIPPVSAPFDSADAPQPGQVTLPGETTPTSYNYVLNGGNYMSGSLDSGGLNTTVVVTAPSVLYVTGNISLNKVVLAPGAKLDLYMANPVISFSPTLVNGTPPQFKVYGLPSVNSISLGGSFTGVIYAPSSTLIAEGNLALFGSITGDVFDCHGTFDFHYDAATQKLAIMPPVTILSWNEK
jgi:hypothetical protein